MLDHVREASLPSRRPAENRPQVRLSCRVLLAEDGPHNQRFLTLFLTSSAFEAARRVSRPNAPLNSQRWSSGRNGRGPSEWDGVRFGER